MNQVMLALALEAFSNAYLIQPIDHKESAFLTIRPSHRESS
jgi:hypothetical protein